MIDIEKPRFESDTAAERVVELKRYLDRLADDLNYMFDVLTDKAGWEKNDEKNKSAGDGAEGDGNENG